MPTPTITFGILLAILLGALFHLVRGGDSKRLLIYLAISLAGFWLGDTIGYFTGWSILHIGLLNTGTAILFSVLLMVGGELLLNRLEAKKD